MTDRQINSYLSRISADDENGELFRNVVVPQLRKAARDTVNPTVCPFCAPSSRALLELESASECKVTFKSYYALVRHLSTQHRHLLPCNGYVLSDIEHNRHRCEPCDMQFTRKDHYNSHLKSQRHQRTSQAILRQQEQKAERQTQLMALRQLRVPVTPITSDHRSQNVTSATSTHFQQPFDTSQEKAYADRQAQTSDDQTNQNQADDGYDDAGDQHDSQITLDQAMVLINKDCNNDDDDDDDNADDSLFDVPLNMNSGEDDLREGEISFSPNYAMMYQSSSIPCAQPQQVTEQHSSSQQSRSEDNTADQHADQIEDDQNSLDDLMLIEALSKFELERLRISQLKRRHDVDDEIETLDSELVSSNKSTTKKHCQLHGEEAQLACQHSCIGGVQPTSSRLYTEELIKRETD